jgi:hypothetical protein
MSGGGPSDFDPPSRTDPKPKGGGGGGGDEFDRCVFTEITTLSSPNAAVIATLAVGDRLNVVYEAGPPQRVVAMTPANVIAGSITSAKLLLIIECIGEGRQYVAIVTAIAGGRVTVEIRPV